MPHISCFWVELYSIGQQNLLGRPFLLVREEYFPPAKTHPLNSNFPDIK